MERVDKFSIMLLKVSKRLDNEELEDMKFLCEKKIVKRKMETITLPLHLFTHLKELMEISEDDLSFLVALLEVINRPDLAQEVEHFQGPRSRVEAIERDENRGENFPQLPWDKECELMNQAFYLIYDNVGRDWKKLIRTLGLPQLIIEQAMYDNPNNRWEQVLQCLNEWWNRDGGTVWVLVQALENCRMRLVSEKLREAINLSHETS